MRFTPEQVAARVIGIEGRLKWPDEAEVDVVESTYQFIQPDNFLVIRGLSTVRGEIIPSFDLPLLRKKGLEVKNQKESCPAMGVCHAGVLWHGVSDEGLDYFDLMPIADVYFLKDKTTKKRKMLLTDGTTRGVVAINSLEHNLTMIEIEKAWHEAKKLKQGKRFEQYEKLVDDMSELMREQNNFGPLLEQLAYGYWAEDVAYDFRARY
ncbi:MAG TPA: hypothetical protein VF828_03220 [Patescibacteria group bacterium]